MRRIPLAGALIPIIFLATALLGLYQLTNYAGLYRLLSEWQIEQFGRYFPFASILPTFLLLLRLPISNGKSPPMKRRSPISLRP